MPGVYCVDATAKTGTLTLDAGGDPNAAWTFLVDGALTGTNFNVVMINGGDACNVTWWVRDAATLTTSNFLGTVLAGAAITVTGGSFSGNALAKAAVTLTGASLVGCDASAGPGGGPAPWEMQSGRRQRSRELRSGQLQPPQFIERRAGGTPGNPGRKGAKK